MEGLHSCLVFEPEIIEDGGAGGLADLVGASAQCNVSRGDVDLQELLTLNLPAVAISTCLPGHGVVCSLQPKAPEPVRDGIVEIRFGRFLPLHLTLQI